MAFVFHNGDAAREYLDTTIELSLAGELGPVTVKAMEYSTITEIDSYLGYEYLQKELALHGIASISIDENITNYLDTYRDTRADLFLATLDEWRRQVETDANNPGHRMLDFDNVVRAIQEFRRGR